MHFEIRNRPDYASLHVLLARGEEVVTEAGAMMAMHADLKMRSSLKGGLMAAAKRAVGGESIIQNTYTATADGQTLDLCPAAPGDIAHIPLTGTAVRVQSGSYLASAPGVEVGAKWAGAKGFFAGEGLILLDCRGEGDLFVSSYGAIETHDVQGTYVVDTSHVVAFEETLDFHVVRPSKGWKALFLSGEGLVVRFRGHGRVWFQTRDPSALARFLHPFRPVRSDHDD